jgi:hypothetical protein
MYADVSQIAEQSIREFMQGASVIAGIDRKTGAKAVFYGREKLLELSKKEDHSTLEGRMIIFSYDNASEELEYLAATVEVIKGYCSYQPGMGIKDRTRP